MLELAHKRIADRPDKYVDHIYGEKELGGTSVVYLSAVPFEKLGFPKYGGETLSGLHKYGPWRSTPCRNNRGCSARCHVRLFPETGFKQ